MPDKSLAGSVSQVPFKGVAKKAKVERAKEWGKRGKIHPGVRARFLGHGGWQGGWSEICSSAGKPTPIPGSRHAWILAQELGYIPSPWCALTGNKGEVIPETTPKLYFVRLDEAKLISERIKN